MWYKYFYGFVFTLMNGLRLTEMYVIQTILMLTYLTFFNVDILNIVFLKCTNYSADF